MPNSQPKIKLDDLIIEVTRKCNMSCFHCLRGRPEDLDMPKEYLENILSRVSAVDCITFTGGEPSLGLEAIAHTLRICRRRKIPVREIYIATNGKAVPVKFIDLLRRWHRYCLESQTVQKPDEYTGGTDALKLIRYLTNDEDGHIGIRIDLSMDNYHDDIPVKNIMDLMMLPGILSTGKYNKENDDGWVIKTGQAAWNGIGDEESIRNRTWAYGEHAKDIEIDRWPDGEYHMGQLYLSCDGSICKYCDYSYEDIEEFAIGSAAGKNWLDTLIEQHFKKEEQQSNG